MLRSGAFKNSSEYASQIFLPYLASQLQQATRVNVVWDVYIPNSLKADTRNQWGECIRRRVEPLSRIPGNCQEFLRVDENKTELFSCLANKAILLETECQIISTHHEDVLFKQHRDVASLAPCTHEEADTRIMLHVADAVREGHNQRPTVRTVPTVRTIDTDILVLAIATTQKLSVTELWVTFGTGKNFRYLAAHEISIALDPDRCYSNANVPCSYWLRHGVLVRWYGQENIQEHLECCRTSHPNILRFNDNTERDR